MPLSGHAESRHQCPLSANSGHRSVANASLKSVVSRVAEGNIRTASWPRPAEPPERPSCRLRPRFYKLGGCPSTPQPWQALRGPARTPQPLRLRVTYRCSLLSALLVAMPWVAPCAVVFTIEQCRAWAGCGAKLKAAIAPTATAAISNLLMALSSLKVAPRGFSHRLHHPIFTRFIAQSSLGKPPCLIPPVGPIAWGRHKAKTPTGGTATMPALAITIEVERTRMLLLGPWPA